ncbi:type I DNA topoisomerase [Sedimentibacter sp. zth1]|uniref:type I DNA topoisomerase n=1 Tax=Sedimentibacter sp. zth1 TaxID=2816908 RepID=UPI001A9192EC|nr:type I DNA topoisomerase [Sedimentibacter sp. zth1]QSX06560.1 type I DNA topoisomerase [Sedimentibacter sp. zth1]
MEKKLVIVESPAKAKTIGKFLGSTYTVKASVGHVRDLPKSKLGIDIENNFEPNYITIRGKGDVIKELKKEAKKAKKVLLATDPDREGEAISWHLANILKLDADSAIRIEFNEITKDAIKKAVKNPRKINTDIVDAQQARRVLDRLVGYNISPLLWRKIEKGLSAGRVQSVALKLICDKEREISDFVSEEYWTLDIELIEKRKKILAKYYGKIQENGKIIKSKLNNEEETNAVISTTDKEVLKVYKVDKKRTLKKPYAPFTTSSLQQEANKKLNFSSKKTMRVAQQLYEGITLKGEGSVGLVTYIRTDSYRISNEAQENVKEYITSNYGDKYYKHNTFSKKNKVEAQDAHEAIRPTSIMRSPNNIKDSLSPEQFKLYNLIWRRFVASQMTEAEYDVTTITFNSNDNIYKASGSIMNFDGFKMIYTYSDGTKDVTLPNINEGDEIKINNVLPEKHYTNPPARYTEASLIKIMEVLGIGRPSTYAPTIITITNREYVVKENKYLMPTEMGILVDEMVVKYFNNIINDKFTAELENKLDLVANGKVEWRKIISDFYDEFIVSMDVADKEIEKVEIKDEVSTEKCEKCGEFMVVKKGRFGKFLACPNYPECKNTKPINHNDVAEETDIVCELCGAKMLKRKGRFGEFLACSNYPSCKNTKQILQKIDVKCPRCGKDLVVKYTKKGRRFFGCSGYPDCDYISWYEPTNEICDVCGNMKVKKNNEIICLKCEKSK